MYDNTGVLSTHINFSQHSRSLSAIKRYRFPFLPHFRTIWTGKQISPAFVLEQKNHSQHPGQSKYLVECVIVQLGTFPILWFRIQHNKHPEEPNHSVSTHFSLSLLSILFRLQLFISPSLFPQSLLFLLETRSHLSCMPP